MIDHVSLPVADLERSAHFYDVVLATIGYERRKQRSGAVGYGPATRPAPVFWILAGSGSVSAKAGLGLHVSFEAPNRESVAAFHLAAIAQGARDAGAPGERPQYTQPFYGAFVFDLDGFKIEAVYRK